MAICEWCDQEYKQTKWWQRFCCSSHKDDWHNHQKRLALVEAAEELRELRLANGANGNGAAPADPKPLSDILKVLPKTEQLSLKRRAW